MQDALTRLAERPHEPFGLLARHCCRQASAAESPWLRLACVAANREDLRERLRKYELELHPDKTRRIEFGRYAERNRKKREEGKPETFDFLGFSHICGKDRRGKNSP